MKRIQFLIDVVEHVQQKHLCHGCGRHQSAQRGAPRCTKQGPAEHLHKACGNFVSRSRTHKRPQESLWSVLAGSYELARADRRHLSEHNLVESIAVTAKESPPET